MVRHISFSLPLYIEALNAKSFAQMKKLLKNDWSWLFLDFSIYFVVFNYTIYIYINLYIYIYIYIYIFIYIYIYIYIYTNSNRQWLTWSIYTNHKGATQLQIKSLYLGFELLSLSPESSNQSTMPYKHNEIVANVVLRSSHPGRLVFSCFVLMPSSGPSFIHKFK